MVQFHAAVVQVHAVDQLVVLLIILGTRGSTFTGSTLDLNTNASHYGMLRLCHLPLPSHSRDRGGDGRPSQG